MFLLNFVMRLYNWTIVPSISPLIPLIPPMHYRPLEIFDGIRRNTVHDKSNVLYLTYIISDISDIRSPAGVA